MNVLHYLCLKLHKNELTLMQGVSNAAFMGLRVHLTLFSPLAAVISLIQFLFLFSESLDNIIVEFFLDYFSK